MRPDLGSRRADDDRPRDLMVRSYMMRASTVNAEGRTVDAILATENPVYAFDLRTYSLIREILVIEGMRNLPSQVVMLDTHDRSSVQKVMGSTRALRVEGKELIGTRHFSSVSLAKDAFTKVAEGHLTDGSIGYRPLKYTELEPGESTQINGRSFLNDGADRLRITYEWLPFEDSIAAIGQDAACKVRAEPTPPTSPANKPTTAIRAADPKDIPMNLEQLIALYGESHRALIADLHGKKKTDAEIAQAVMAAVATSARAMITPPVTVPPAAQPGDEALRAQILAAERGRVTAIRAAAGSDMPVEMVNRAIDENWDMARANTEFLAEMRRSRSAPVQAGGGRGQAAGGADPIEILASNEDRLQRAIETTLTLRAFSNSPHRLPTNITAEQRTEARDLTGIGLQDLARVSLRAHRQAVPIQPNLIFQRALSTISFPVALGNTLNRVLQRAYETAPSSLMRWASTASVRDFRENKSIKLGKFARPVKVGKGGQVEHGQIGEEAEGFSADTYATRLAISRQDFINDDLGIFDTIAVNLGDSMRMNVDDIGYDLLTSAAGLGPTLDADAKSLFSTTHVDVSGSNPANPAGINYVTGGTYVLSSVGLTELKRILRLIKSGGRLLNLMPKYLLVPAALEQKALELITSSNIIIGGTADVRGDNNVHKGTLEVIVEPRLDGGTDGATAWYLVCDQARARSLQVAFLNGNQSPVLERSDPTDTLGIGWLGYHDVGVDAVDWRGIVRSKGA